MTHTRKAAVAGRFYPRDQSELRALVDKYLRVERPPLPAVKALIAPHAGYPYSGPIAGSAYAQLSPLRGRIRRVLLIGPAHFVLVRGLAASSAEFFSTPLGDVPVDRAAVEQLLQLPQVSINDDAHEPEHSLEVHLPFLQEVLGEFEVVPLLVGQAKANDVAEVIERFWDAPETLIVISSDLSHFHDYRTAVEFDTQTSAAIERLEPAGITAEHACGYRGIQGLMQVARRHGATARILDVRNSGDTAGSRDRVVGYGAYAVE